MVIELLLKIRVVQQGQYALFQRLTAGIDDPCNAFIHGGANERHQQVDKTDTDCDIEIRKRGHTHTPDGKRLDYTTDIGRKEYGLFVAQTQPKKDPVHSPATALSGESPARCTSHARAPPRVARY